MYMTWICHRARSISSSSRRCRSSRSTAGRISEQLHQVSRATLQVPQGSLYPALHRLERRGWIRAEWAVSENNRRAKYYQLTRSGRKHLEVVTDQWHRLTAAVSLVLEMG